ncbi:MAG: FtsX-like permease family protein [Saprospiraceae bacterium]|nr:ABC transporter permease [Saprospiraceae bacterium]
MLFKLAYKNLEGAGLRTWLTVGVLSFAFVIIILINGIVNGFNDQAINDAVNWEIGNGKLQNEKYDAYDPFSIKDGHGILPDSKNKDLVPVLIRQASIYPQGRMVSVTLNGIDINQKLLKLPTILLQQSTEEIPAIIGKRMAASANLKKGDQVLMRWRDSHGTFDAANISVAGIFNTNVTTVDAGQIWISLKKLRAMTDLDKSTTLFIAEKDYKQERVAGWKFLDQDELLKDLRAMVQIERISDSIIYLLLLAIALLAIFDTQVLSVFRRQREIGTYISLGMTRPQVVGLFTIEGSMNSILAIIVGGIYGIPLFLYLSYYGIAIPAGADNMGLSMGEKITPVFGAGLVLGTISLVVISSTIVSFLPSRKIAKMNPVDALKGKIQ